MRTAAREVLQAAAVRTHCTHFIWCTQQNGPHDEVAAAAATAAASTSPILFNPGVQLGHALSAGCNYLLL
jgi:hypothetical protein